MKSSEVVILGGGAAGCMTAYYLGKEGVKATVVEREAIGSHASGFAFGGLSFFGGAGIPGPVFPLAKEAYHLHETLFEELKEMTGIDTYYRKGKNIKLAFDEEQAREIDEEVDWQKREGLDSRIVSWDEVRSIEPRINQAAIKFRLIGESAEVEAYRLVIAMMQAAEKMGATLRHGNVVGIKRQGGRPSALVFETGEQMPCDTVVVALGPWSGQASSWLDFPVPITPLKGQILRLEMDGPPLACWLNFAHSYCGTKPDGLTWCGTTEEEAGFDDATTPGGLNVVMNDAVKMVPDLVDAKLALQTACLRPMSSDQLPIIGPVPGWDGAYLATGGGRKGVLLASVMGRVMADLILRGETPVDISSLLPDRFAPATTS
jgi:glycine oxidase